MKRIFWFTAIAMILSAAAGAQMTDTTSIKKPSEAELMIKELVTKLYSEKEGRKAELVAAEIVRNIDTNPLWKGEKTKRDMYRMHPLYAYLNSEDFEGFKDFLARLGEVTGTERIHFAKGGYARRAVAKGIDLDFAGQIIRKEREWARKVMLDTLNKGHPGRMYTYALFTMDYAKLLHLKGEKQHAFDLMREAMEYNRRERKEAEITDYYLAMAADFLPQNELKNEMEALIKGGMSTAGIIERLGVVYTKEKGSKAGFENYITSLHGDQVKEKMAALRKVMLNEAAPLFSLKDLNGNEISLHKLKGKTVVLDFWATWCGPCIASFPAMQILVDRYKNNPNIQFLFIDTWEQGDNKNKKAKDLIAKSKYTFQVLMDDHNEVVEKYKIKGIPAKFVIDKNGVLRFRATGFANDAELMNEIDAMIQLAN